MGDDEEDEGLLWVDEADEVAKEATIIEANDSERVAGLEAELARTRTELTEVRRELAAKVRMCQHAWLHDQVSWIDLRHYISGLPVRCWHRLRMICLISCEIQTVQLTRREQAALQEKAQEIASMANTERDTQLQLTIAQVSQLEISLAQKEEVRSLALEARGIQSREFRQCFNRYELIVDIVLFRSWRRAAGCTPLKSVP